MFYSAAGGGVLIALMALFKTYLGSIIDDKVWKGIAEGLNYGLGFTGDFYVAFYGGDQTASNDSGSFCGGGREKPAR